MIFIIELLIISYITPNICTRRISPGAVGVRPSMALPQQQKNIAHGRVALQAGVRGNRG